MFYSLYQHQSSTVCRICWADLHVTLCEGNITFNNVGIWSKMSVM